MEISWFALIVLLLHYRQDFLQVLSFLGKGLYFFAEIVGFL
jgi:hypothetical protein